MRRLVSFVIFAGSITLFLVFLYHAHARRLLPSAAERISHVWSSHEDDGQSGPPAGGNDSRTLVLATVRSEDTSWVQSELGGLLASGQLDTAVYHMDDPSQPLHPIANKGNEAMAYLTYLIEFYDALPAVVVFLHAHRYAWHTDALFDTDAATVVRRLSLARVRRDGYMNLRCQWDPGCPRWMHPGATDDAAHKPEQALLGRVWRELFPGAGDAPAVLAQACGAQFAVSRERVRAVPRARYEALRDWLLYTKVPTRLAGRVFEYVWQYLFTGEAVFCPTMDECYCDGFGACFGGIEGLDGWFEVRYRRHQFSLELNQKRRELVGRNRKQDHPADPPDASLPDRIAWLEREIPQLDTEMDRQKEDAFRAGRDPRVRARAATREWKEGDGF